MATGLEVNDAADELLTEVQICSQKQYKLIYYDTQQYT